MHSDSNLSEQVRFAGFSQEEISRCCFLDLLEKSKSLNRVLSFIINGKLIAKGMYRLNFLPTVSINMQKFDRLFLNT